MAVDVQKINGVDKLFLGNGNILYLFPIASITVNTDTTEITIISSRVATPPTATNFADLSNNYGTADAEEYVDYLATNGFFFDESTGGGGTSDVNVISQSAGLSLESKQDIGNTSLSNIDTKTPNDPATVTKQNEIITAISGIIGGVEISFPKVFTDISGALHTEQFTTQIDLKQTKDNLPLFFHRINSGGATQIHSTANAQTAMSVAGGSDYAIAQTFERFNYLTGKTKRIILTCTNFGVQSNVVKRVGYFNGGVIAPYTSFDGIYLESDGTTINVCLAKLGVVNSVSRASWDDPVDGTGASGLDINFDNYLIIRIEFLWLGGGSVRFQIETNDEIYTFHTFKNGALLTETYMQSPNQPIRYEIRSTGGSGLLNQICATVGNSGGNDNLGVERGYANFKNVQLSSTNNNYLAYAVRLKSTYLDVSISILDFFALFTTNDNFEYAILLNATYSTSLTYTPIPNSALEIATGNGSITVSGGIVLRSGFGSLRTVIDVVQENVLRLGSQIDGTQTEIAFYLRPLTGNARANSSFNWIENT